jgi:CBS domain-containing protein/beta-phosphoglucomutase-like phosphatase (HAD superfamily)
MLQALIIRADGALAETEELTFRVFEQVFEEAGFAWRTDAPQFYETAKLGGCAYRIRHLLQQTVRWRAATADMTPLIAAMQRRVQKLLATRLLEAKISPRPYMVDLVAAARRDGLKVAVISSIRAEPLTILLTKTLGANGPGLFDVAVPRTDDDMTFADFYRTAIDKLGIPAADCLIIEGTVSAARAARALGIGVLTTRSATCNECYGDDGDPPVIEDLPSLISRDDSRRLDPLTADERAELLAAMSRLHAGNCNTSNILNWSSAMRVSDILKSKGTAVKTIEPQASIRSLARSLRSESVGVMVITDAAGTLKGIISERDLARGLAEFGNDLSSMCVSDLMTTAVVTCRAEDGVANVARIMTERRIRHLPVVAGTKLIGLISIGDVLKHRLDEVQLEANVLRDVAIARK